MTVGKVLVGVGGTAALFVLWNLAGAPGYTPTLPLDDQAPESDQGSGARPGGAPDRTVAGMETKTVMVNGVRLFLGLLNRVVANDRLEVAAQELVEP